MEAKFSFLGYIGLLCLVIGLLGWAIITQMHWFVILFLILGGLSLLGFASMNVEYLKYRLTKKSTAAGANMFVSVIIFGAIIVFIQILLTRHSSIFDMTEAKKFSLATQTTQLLEGIEEPINMLYLENPQDPGGATRAKELMELYKHYSDELTYEMIDPEREPEKVEELAPVSYGAIYLQKGAVHEKVSPIDENNLTNAFLKLVKGGSKVIYFTTGHDEGGLESQEPAGMFAMNQVLTEEGYEPKELQLYTMDSVPEDAVAVVIAGPRKPFFEPELEALKNYLDQGGKVFVMLDPERDTGLDAFFAENYGIVFGNDWIVEFNPLMRLLNTSPNQPMAAEMGDHPIMQAFQNGMQAMSFPIVQSVKLSPTMPEGMTGTEILKTGAQSWIKTDLEEIKRTKLIDPNPLPGEERGPVSLAVAVSKPIEVTDSPDESEEEITDDNVEKLDETPEMRIVAFGDANFAQNSNYRSSMDLFTNAVNWLSQQEDLISIRPKDDSGQPVMVSVVSAKMLFYTSLIITPGVVAAFGTFICLRRRYRG